MPEFEIHRCLGRGGFGEVYRGVMSRGGGIAMDVAVKVLRPDLDPSSQGVQRLRDEGRLLGRLTHPTILRVYDLVVIEGRAALITEFVDGDDLARVIRGPDQPPARAIFEIIAQVAAALDAAWSWPSVTDGQPLHLVHRDIKPDNIRLDPHGLVKLLDFGIAQASSIEREAETSVNIIMGSAQYLAPERMVQQEVGPESDVFALGCTMYEALAGEALFHRKSMRQMYLLMVEEHRLDEFVAERLDALPGPALSERARSLLLSMLAYHKADRPTAGDVAARCDAISDSIKGMTLRRWARSHDWPPPATEEGPLEGRSFTTAQPLPAPGVRTLHLRPPALDRPPPDLSETDTDPEARVPVLGELDAAHPDAPQDDLSPYSDAERVALGATEGPEAPPLSGPVPEAVEITDSPANAATQALDTDEIARDLVDALADPDGDTTDPRGPQPVDLPPTEAPTAPPAPPLSLDDDTDIAERVPSVDTDEAAATLPADFGAAPAPPTVPQNAPQNGPATSELPRAGLVGPSFDDVLAASDDVEDDDSPTVKITLPAGRQVTDEVIRETLKKLESTDLHDQAPVDPLLAEALALTPPGVERVLPKDDEPQLPDIGHVSDHDGLELQEATDVDDDLPIEPTEDGFAEPEVVEQAHVSGSPSGSLHTRDAVIDLHGTPPIQPYRVDGPPSDPGPLDAEEAPAAPEPEEPPAAEEPAPEPPVDTLGGPELTDDYEPKPGDVDLSDVFGGQGSGDVQLRVAPPGAEVAERPKRRRKSKKPGRASVMLFSGLMGILVGAAIFSIPALLIWLFS